MRRPRHVILAALTVVAVSGSLVGAGLVLRASNQRDGARSCALANQILNAIDVNRIVLEDTLSTLRDDRAEAAAAAEADNQLADAVRRQAAAQRYAQLAQRLQPIRRFDC